jgi:CHAD domain-containing protein
MATTSPQEIIKRAASKPELRRAAAATAVAGAAVAAGKLGLERARADRPSREYRLKRSESVPEGIRRMALGQIDDALEQLEAGGSPDERDGAVHEARKSMKRVRSLLRLVRDELGAEVYRRENGEFRAVGRVLSPIRDSRVTVESLDALVERTELRAHDVAGLRAALVERHTAARRLAEKGGEAFTDAVSTLEAARERVPDWPLERDSFGAVKPGARRMYRRGRRAMAAASDEPSDEHLHEWRKRVKDLWYHTQILESLDKRRMKAFAEQAHELSTLLGDDHDLAVLRVEVDQRPEAFERPEHLDELTRAIGQRRRELQLAARGLGATVYADKPKRYVGRLKRCWRKARRATAAKASTTATVST